MADVGAWVIYIRLDRSVAGLRILNAMPNGHSRTPLAELFWPKVDRSGGPDACWPWTGHRNSKGYGSTHIWSDGKWRTVGAHRVAYTLERGPIAAGLQVCHVCDNPPCCNPAHHFLGTVRDNSRDMAAKGRTGTAPGMASTRARLTDADVREIRRLRSEGMGVVAIGQRFGIHSARVSMIARGLQWKHVDGERAPADARRVSKLTPEDVAELRRLRDAGAMWKALGERFGIHPTSAKDIYQRP